MSTTATARFIRATLSRRCCRRWSTIRPSTPSSILAHSMGNYLVMESLRQMAIRDRGLSPKIRDVMMAAPDIDIDVFRRQIAEIDAGPRPAYFTLFVSRDDRALGISSFLARDSTRLGALDPTEEPYRSILEKGRVQVVDLTKIDFDRLHQPQQVRERRGRRRDWRAPGAGPDAQRGQGGSGRIARLLHRRRDRRRSRRGHRRRRRADRDF